ncbi:MAG: hypothetical protein L0219_22465 [Phycisphaerales bacterium]|nr:hypothetical protein [Phycisphaerales bacterium]
MRGYDVQFRSTGEEKELATGVFVRVRRGLRSNVISLSSIDGLYRTLSGINAFVAYMSSWIYKSIGNHDTNIVSAGAAEQSTAPDSVSSEHRGAAHNLSMIATASPT